MELHLDSITSSYAGEKLLPRALFKHCPNVTVLSLRSNYIRSIPPDIGRLKRLRRLCLTNNNLQVFQVHFGDSVCLNFTRAEYSADTGRNEMTSPE